MSPIHPLDEHAAWARSLWFPSECDGLDATGASMANLAVIGLGLAGEALETLEAALPDGELDTAHAAKELGDVLYYWCVACARVGLAPLDAWPPDHSFRLAPPAASREAIFMAGARHALASGHAAEAVKKMIRDGADGSKLAAALPILALRWTQLCSALGLSAQEVALANREKLAGRLARGTLAGDGNDR